MNLLKGLLQKLKFIPPLVTEGIADFKQLNEIYNNDSEKIALSCSKNTCCGRKTGKQDK